MAGIDKAIAISILQAMMQTDLKHTEDSMPHSNGCDGIVLVGGRMFENALFRFGFD